MSYTEAVAILSQCYTENLISPATYQLLSETIQDPPIPIQLCLLHDLERLLIEKRIGSPQRAKNATTAF